jgi:tetratricopeptide (TPR) repeat protein
MGFYQEYELLGLVQDGPTKTLRAREIATDRAVFLHLLTGAMAPEAQQSLLKRAEELASRTSSVLTVGEFAGTRYVVTETIEPFSTLEQWIAEMAAGESVVPRSGSIQTSAEPAGIEPTLASVLESAVPLGGSTTVLADRPPDDGPGPDAALGNGSSFPSGSVAPEQGLRELTGSMVSSGPANLVSQGGSVRQPDQSRRPIENEAVRNALETLESALNLGPADPEVLRLVGKGGRPGYGQEAVDDLRTSKEALYQKALEDWQQGDLEAAQVGLDRLFSLENDPRAPRTERSQAYRELRQRVRQDSQALEASYAEARAQMQSSLEQALTICDACLAKYPNHTLFKALRYEIGERTRQEALPFIVETDRRVDAEPDLGRRIEILEEALKRRPEEPHFKEGIRLLREKQQLVASIVEKAHSLEGSQRYAEALEKWELVESIQSQLPGLQANIQRLEQRIQEQKARYEARGRCITQAKANLKAGDYEQAMKLVQEARRMAPAPDDPELRQVELEASHGLQRGETIREHLREAQQLWGAGRRTEGLDRLRQAQRLDPRNALVRGELVNALVETARHQVESDWASAQPLVEEALKLAPNHAVAVRLLEQIGYQKRDELVSWCLVETRRLRARGELEAAHRVVFESRQRYPEDDRLRSLEGLLARELGLPDAPPDETSEALYYTPTPGQDAASWPADSGGLAEVAASRDTPSAGWQSGYQGDTGFSQDTGVSQDTGGYNLATPAERIEPVTGEFDFAQERFPTPRPESAGAAREPQKLKKSLVETEEDLLSRLAHESGTPRPAPPPDKTPAQPERPSRWVGLRKKLQTAVEAVRRRPAAPDSETAVRAWPLSPLQSGIAAAVALVVIIGAAWLWKVAGQSASPAAGTVLVSVQSSPPGATLIVDGQDCGVSNCQLELSAESHRVEARLAGYQPAAISFEAGNGAPAQPVVVTLLPLPPVLHLSSDLASGQVTLDGKRIGELEDGSFDRELSELSPGEHTLRLSSAGTFATISFEAPAGAAPRYTAPPRVSSLKGVVIASLGSVAHVFGTEAGAAVRVDGQPAGALGGEPLVLENLSQGPHELILGSGKDERKIVFDTTESPLLAAFLNSDRNVGSLYVAAGQDDVTIFLNGTEYRRKTARGRRLIYLYPKQYEVRVEKEGFRTPAVQIAEVRKGEEVRLEFELTPLPQTAILRVINGVPGTEVSIDGQVRGVIRSGLFTLPSIEPGKHVIRLARENYKAAEIERQFGSRATVEVDGTLESAVGTLEIQINPAGADSRLTLQREGEGAPRVVTEKTLQLPPGNYVVQASAPGFQDGTATVRVFVDQTRAVTLTLRRREEPKPSVPTVTLADWERAGWRREEKLLVRRGGDFVAAGSGGAGRYTFTALLQKGRRLEWAVNYFNQDNHVLYQLGKDFLHRTEVTRGKRSRTVKIPHRMRWEAPLSVEVIVRPDAIIHRVLVGSEWVELDNWKQPGSNFTVGKFGFHIPGRDQVGLSQFAFVPER